MACRRPLAERRLERLIVLQPHPKLRRNGEVASQAQGSISGYAPFVEHVLIDALGLTPTSSDTWFRLKAPMNGRWRRLEVCGAHKSQI